MQTKQIAWNTGDGNITMTYQGYGDGDITVNSDPNNLDTARSQTITIETTAGSPAVVKNFTVSQGACPFPVGDVRNFAYTGNVQSVILPAGKYKLQCWGAQGGTCSSWYSGGKGGYSEGVLTLTSPTTVETDNGADITGDPGQTAEYPFSIQFVVPANETIEPKTCQIVVTDDGGTAHTCLITLAAGDAYLTVGQPSGELPWDGSTSVTISVESNTSWTIE